MVVDSLSVYVYAENRTKCDLGITMIRGQDYGGEIGKLYF